MAILKYQINFFIIPKPSIDLTDIFLMQMRLNFDFIFNSILCLIFNNLLFKKRFQDHNKFTFNFSSKINLPKLAPPQGFSNLKISNLPFLRIKTCNTALPIQEQLRPHFNIHAPPSPNFRVILLTFIIIHK